MRPSDVQRWRVVSDRAEALACRRAVLILPPGEEAPTPPEGTRLAVLVGDPDDPVARTAAEELAAELAAGEAAARRQPGAAAADAPRPAGAGEEAGSGAPI